MKKLFLLPIFALSLFLISCGGDDNGDCVQADYVGTYEGTMTLAGVDTDATFTVTAVGSNQIAIDEALENIDVNGCKLEGGTTILGTGNEYSGNLDGTTITINETIKAVGLDAVTTTWTGVKQ